MVGAGERPEQDVKGKVHEEKVMFSVSWTVFGVVYWELLPYGANVTADMYSP